MNIIIIAVKSQNTTLTCFALICDLLNPPLLPDPFSLFFHQCCCLFVAACGGKLVIAHPSAKSPFMIQRHPREQVQRNMSFVDIVISTNVHFLYIHGVLYLGKVHMY